MLTVFIIGGSGSSSGSGGDINSEVKNAFEGFDAEFHFFTPFRFKRKCEAMNHIIVRNTNNILFIAKSLGAYKLYTHLDRLVLPNNQVGIVTIDPHAPFWRCGPNHPITPQRRIPAINVYQRCKYPRGAVVKHIFKNIEVKNTDHNSIVRSREAWWAYKTMLKAFIRRRR